MRSVRCAKTSRVSQTALVRCMYPRQSGGNATHPGQVEDHQQSSGQQLEQATGIHSMASRLKGSEFGRLIGELELGRHRFPISVIIPD